MHPKLKGDGLYIYIYIYVCVQVKEKLYTIYPLPGKKLETLIKEYHAWLPPPSDNF